LAAVVGVSGCGTQDREAEHAGDSHEGHATESAPDGDDGASAVATFHRDVRPIIARHCVRSCHEPGTVAPFSFESYDEVFRLREAIANAVESRTMPPWLAGPGCAEYKGDRSLTDEEIETIAAWADDGGVEGNPDDYTTPTGNDRPGLSRVDVSVRVPEPYVPQRMPDDYRCFIVDWPETQTSYVTGVRATPGNYSVVHHVITYAIEPDKVEAYQALDDAEPGPGYTCYGGPGASENDWSAGRWIGAWAPGGEGYDFPGGTGLRMEPGSKVVVQVHYNSLAGDGQPDQTTVEYRIDREVETEAHMLLWANPDWLFGEMPIPAGAQSTVHSFAYDPTAVMRALTTAVGPNTPFLIHNVAHHMHTRGVRALQKVVRADGSEDCLVDMPNYDFDWQSGYRFAEPIVFNPGDKLHVECEWDNTGTDVDVNWGEGTDDEMCLAVLYIAEPDP
jgi:hypothetical protein